MLAIGLIACQSATPTMQKAPGAPTVLLRGRGEPVRVAVELARTPRERSKGLMHREKLGPNEGMLFLFDRTEIQKFWMKNTLIALDMIFIDRKGEDLKVVGVESNAEPLTTQPRGPDVPSRYVLEVVGGWAEAHGITAGTSVEFSGFEL
jgi:uncharacterized membrane protein (UPF0127 family)